ncbi:MAG: hypothetical protein V4606_04535 [Patescibacteria group bacterium]
MKKQLLFYEEPLKGFEMLRTLAVVTLLAGANIAQAQDNMFCLQWAVDDLQLEISEKFTLSGPELVDGKWSAPHDTMTIQFRNEPPMVWSPENTFKGGLLDFIWTAAHHQEMTGSPAFAGRDEKGYTWAISKLAEPGTPNTVPCMAHPLGWSK